jgi:kinesin family protein 5
MSRSLRRSLTKCQTKQPDESPLTPGLCKRNTNIKVIARFRPLIPIEKDFGEETPLKFEFPNENTVLVPQGETYEPYVCDRVFSSSSSQEEVYEFTGFPTVSDVLEGYNGTIFAYGQTGSGKTYTMMGSIYDHISRGVIPRTVGQIFRSASFAPLDIEYTLKCSMLEIYKESLRDLLSGNESLKIKECVRRGIYVEGLTEVFVASEEEVFSVLETGEKARTVASTRMNQVSSRSHQLFSLEIRQKFSNETEKKGVLNLIDLAGSEKIKDTGVSGTNLDEAKKINLSLSALGNVIHALTSMSEHIPYRDSKLTRLLQESLGGNYKTSLIITCSPSVRNLEETIKTLKFAQRAKKIRTNAKMNIKSNSECYLKIIDDLK